MSRTVRPPLPVVSTDGRADARGSVVVSLDTARACLAALAGLTVHPWPGVEDAPVCTAPNCGWGCHNIPRRPLSLAAALVGVPDSPEAIIAAVDALEADGRFESDNSSSFWRPDVRSLGGSRYEWQPWNGGERAIVLHFRGDDAVISWRADVGIWCNVDSGTAAGLVGERTGTRGHRSRFIGRVIGWASPRSVAVAPMAGHSGPVRAI